MDIRVCSDEELVLRYRSGEENAIEVIFERYKNLVRKKAKAMYLAGGDSDDLIQEGMIGLYKAVRGYHAQKEASFSTFASMCINRQMITAVTASNRKKNTPLNTYISIDTPAEKGDSEVRLLDVLQPEIEQNPEKLLIDREYAKDLQTRLYEVLSPFETQVLDLYLEGKDYIQIADTLKRSSKSVDNALQRIRTKIKKI
jgi:RNA polymerase sporulation-specific sigma factor